MADRVELIPGTLDMLILKTLTRGSLHGYGIALSINRFSKDVFTVKDGSLYTALHRLSRRGWVNKIWNTTENKRRVCAYSLTKAGQQQLKLEASRVESVINAIGYIMSDAKM